MSLMKARERRESGTEGGGEDDTQHLMCTAHGCPNRWAVDSPDKGINRLCSSHAWAPADRWPSITAANNWEVTERARTMTNNRPNERPLSLEAKRAILDKLRVAAERMRKAEVTE